MLDINEVFKFLRSSDVKVQSLAHLGANQAQDRETYIKNGVSKILWIEALPTLVDFLNQKLRGTDDLVLQGVLSDVTGETVQFNVASNSGMSSSIFEFEEHTKQYPSIQMIGSLNLTTTTLEDLLTASSVVFDYDMAVLDLQGAELKALMGASSLIKRCSAVICEVSCIELYKGAPRESDIDSFMESNGFRKTMSSYTQYGWGEALYIKGVF